MAPRPLQFGEALAPLHLASNRNPRFATSSLGGRFVLICALPDLSSAEARATLAAVAQARPGEPERVICVLTSAPAQSEDEHLRQIARAHIVFHDAAGAAFAAWGLADAQGEPAALWALIDPSLRVLAIWPLQQAATAIAALAATPEPGAHAGVPLHAPVLIAPRIFEPSFCRTLIEAYEHHGGAPSGTTKENEAGKTYVALDDAFKRRTDYAIEDAKLRDAAMHRLYWRLLPEIEKAFAARMTRMERYIVACYDAGSGGYFKPHRDNTTKGTAHRRFAVTINLNAEDYDGGDLRFPEFGARTYRAPTGGAVVFSCSLLHEATPVTRGKRFAFLPFLYDEAAAKLRSENAQHLDESLSG